MFQTWRAISRGTMGKMRVRGGEGTVHVFCEFYDVGLRMLGSEIKRCGLEDMSF